MVLWGAGATRAALAAAIIAAGDAKGNRAPLGIKLGVAPQAYGSKRYRGDLRQSRYHHHTIGGRRSQPLRFGDGLSLSPGQRSRPGSQGASRSPGLAGRRSSRVKVRR